MKNNIKEVISISYFSKLAVLSAIIFAVFLSGGCKDSPAGNKSQQQVEEPNDPDDDNNPEEAVTAFELEDIPAIDSAIAAFMTEYNVKGVSIAVTKNERLVYAKGYGFANITSEALVDTSSLFRIASLSKFITAAGVMKLIEENRLDLEDKVFGPEAVLENDYYQGYYPKYIKDIRVRDLLYHEVGGWSNSGVSDPAFAKDELKNVADLIKWAILDQRLDKEPGTKYDYSNLGYMVLGEIIEKVSGRSYKDFIYENILLPSGVTNMKISNDNSAGRLPGEVSYYGPYGPVGYDTDGIIHRLGSAGGWIASAIDLTRILVHIDKFDRVPDILDQDTITLMTTPSALSDYAGGFHINPSSKNWWHSGGLTGTSTWLVRTPNGYTWTILTNSSDTEGTIYTGLNNLIWGAVNNPATNWTTGDLF